MNKDKEAMFDAIAFVGETLAPFYLEDPLTGNAGSSFRAIGSLELNAASEEWPFVSPSEAKRGLTLMQQGLQNDANEELAWEYRRLFIGPAPKPAPPWGSVYTDRESVVFGQTTLVLRAWMREQGITRFSNEKTPEDHIGLLLILMAWIARNRSDMLGEYLALHVLTWSSHFLQQLQQAAEQSFYEGLALLTQASLEGIQQQLKLKVVYPRFYR